MKLRSTTPVLRRLTTKIILVVFAIVMTITLPMSTIEKAFADQWDDQISNLQAKADAYQAEANKLRAKADTLQNKLNLINAQKAALEAKIATNQTKMKKLKADIALNETKLKESQDVLGEILANLYIDDEISPFEQLASSDSIGDYIDKQEYRSSVRDQLNTTIVEIKDIKIKLEGDKKSVEKVLANLKQQNDQLAAVQSEQQYLVNKTRGEEASYQKLVQNAKSQLQSVHAQQQAYYASLVSSGGGNSGVVGSFQYSGWSGNKGCSGGYPYCMAQDTWVDPWNLYNRECVSYVAWALKNRFGKSVQAWHGDGNAYEWPSSAARWSGAWRVYSPQPGDVVVLPQSGWFAPIGHVMIVESVTGDGMFVSQYNFYGTGQYSTMFVKNSGVILLRFPNA